MKRARLFLLLLLAALLPLRGVMAAAMLCTPLPAAATTQASHAHHTEAAHAADAGHAGGHHDDRASGPGSCNQCSTCCTVPPLGGVVPALPQPVERAAMAYPAPSVPAPSFVSGGPDRPPRSI